MINNKLLVGLLIVGGIISSCVSTTQPDTLESSYRKRMNRTWVRKLDAQKDKAEIEFLLKSKISDPQEVAKYTVTSCFVVGGIYQGHGFYEIILYDTLDSLVYDVISLNAKCKVKEQKIRVGTSYLMTLYPYLEKYANEKVRCSESPVLLYLDGYKVFPGHLLFGQIYTTDNLIGLQFVEQDKRGQEH